MQKRLADSIETVLHLSSGILVVDVIGKEELMFSQNFACSDCGISIEELSPRMFSFNNPFGACPTCGGLGTLLKIDPDLIIPDRSKSFADGAIKASGWNVENQDSYSRMYLNALAKHYGFSLDTPVEKLPASVLDIILYGTKGEKIKVVYEKEYGSGSFMTAFEGIITSIERRYR
jgi:excinuclease ABC subunit A